MFKRLLHGVQRFEVGTEDWACCGSLFCCIEVKDPDASIRGIKFEAMQASEY